MSLLVVRFALAATGHTLHRPVQEQLLVVARPLVATQETPLAKAPLSPLPPILLDKVGALLADHDGGRVGVPAHHVGHDGS